MESKDSIMEYINENLELVALFKHMYIFGSVIDPNIVHNDVDVLIIYEKYSAEIKNALQSISNGLEKASGLFIDVTALSIEEERDVAFLERIKPHYLKIK